MTEVAAAMSIERATTQRAATEINYTFILGMYVFFLALGVVFAGLEFGAKARYQTASGLVLRSDFFAQVDAVAGFYLIFAPFLPATFWCLLARRRWLSEKLHRD